MKWSAVAAALLVGCAGPEVTDEGVHVVVVADAGLEMCGGTLAHMDAFIAAAAREFGVEAPLGDDRLTLYWMVEAFHARSGCDATATGCAQGSSAWVASVPVDHEFVHNLTEELGAPTGFFVEGIAVAYEGLGGDGMPEGSIEGLVSASSQTLLATPGSYVLAGAFSAYLVEQHGLAAYWRAYAAIDRDADDAAIDAAFVSAFGVSLADSIAGFDRARRSCPHGVSTAKLVECAAPTIEWRDGAASLHRSLACEQDDVIGPHAGDLAVALHTLEIPAGGEYEISVIGDHGQTANGTENTATLVRCGGCALPTSLRIEAGEPPRVVTLPAGRYALRLTGPATVPTSVGVRVAASPVGGR